MAIDLGAESGRAVVGRIGDDGRLRVEEVHRFPNRAVAVGEHLHWDFERLLSGCLEGLGAASLRWGRPVSVGVDTWGVDFALLDGDGALTAPPQCYRDPDGPAGLAAFRRQHSLDELYSLTGIQILPINSLFRLAAMAERGDDALARARHLLFMPGLIDHALCGARLAEATCASTSQLMDAVTGDWSRDLLGRIGVRADLLPPIAEPGAVVGCLAETAAVTGLGGVPVVAVGSHDTASAVAAVPAQDERFAYLSSGTWSLFGIERGEPLIDNRSRAANLTNERGVAGTFRLLRNVSGLWLLQQCRRSWEAEGDWPYDRLAAAAEAVPGFRSLIDPDHPFDPALDMTAQIAALCRATGQPVPDTPPEFARCIFDSLALAYRRALAAIRAVSGLPIERLHIVGGGARNRLLDQLTADATGLPVVAGPIEATAIGNLLVQAMALGDVGDLRGLRGIVARSVPLEQFEPDREAASAWAEADGAMSRRDEERESEG